VAEDRGTALVLPLREGVLGSAVRERLRAVPALEARDVAVGGGVRGRQRGVDVADDRLRVVGETLVQPGALVTVLVVLQQVLVLVRERPLVQTRTRGQRL